MLMGSECLGFERKFSRWLFYGKQRWAPGSAKTQEFFLALSFMPPHGRQTRRETVSRQKVFRETLPVDGRAGLRLHRTGTGRGRGDGTPVARKDRCALKVAYLSSPIFFLLTCPVKLELCFQKEQKGTKTRTNENSLNRWG